MYIRRMGELTGDDSNFCLDLARKYDHDRFLACLLAPAHSQMGLFVLLAFNSELARARESVSEPMLGEIRLQWWRDAMDGIFLAKPRRHPTCLALADMIRERPLHRYLFEQVIDARSADMTGLPPEDLDGLVEYARATTAPLHRLLLLWLGIDDEQVFAVSDHVAIAWSLTGLLRATNYLAQQHRLVLPKQRLLAYNVQPDDVMFLHMSEGLGKVVKEIVDCASSHLAEARLNMRSQPRAALPILSLARLADTYLAKIKQFQYDPFYDTSINPLKRQLFLTWARIRGRY